MTPDLRHPLQLPREAPESPAGRLVRLLYWYVVLVAGESDPPDPLGAQDLLRSQFIGPLAAWVRTGDAQLPKDRHWCPHPGVLLAARLLAGLVLHHDGHHELVYDLDELNALIDQETRSFLRQYTLEAEWRRVCEEVLGALSG